MKGTPLLAPFAACAGAERSPAMPDIPAQQE
jgi:hypothetical protein